MLTPNNEIEKLKEVRAYHLQSAEEAAHMISKLEGAATPSSSQKGLSEEDRNRHRTKLRKRFYK